MNALLIIFILSYFYYAFYYEFGFILIFITITFLYTLLTQFIFFKTPYNGMRNKMTVATWGETTDPQIYGKVKLNLTKMEPYLEKLSAKINVKVTLTIFSIKLVSIVLSKFEIMNSYIKFGKINTKSNIDIACAISIGDGNDLANCLIKSCEQKSIKEIIDEIHDSSKKLREKKNEDHLVKGRLSQYFPNLYVLSKYFYFSILALLMQITSYISSIGYSIKQVDLKKFEFGTCVVTSIGSLGIEDGHPPIPPPTFVPLVVAICKAKTKYEYNSNNKIQENKYMKLNLTVDSRFVDPATAESFVAEMKRIGENPEIFEKEISILLAAKK